MILSRWAAFFQILIDVPRYQKVLDYTYEMFLGWKRMCMLSKDGSCQEDEGFQCGGGQYPCLPHWKFDDDLTGIIGKGAAPDGDADACHDLKCDLKPFWGRVLMYMWRVEPRMPWPGCC